MSVQKQIKGIVFDFDGTLAELMIDFSQMKQAIADLAATYLQEPLQAPPSPPALEWAEILAERMSPDQALEFKAKTAELIVEIELEAASRGRLFDFSRELLAEIGASRLKVGIITRNCRAAVARVFPDLAGFCSVFLAREDAAEVKPKPGHLLQALELLKLAPQNALVVGDHPLDIETGRRAETLTASVATGRVGLDELVCHMPDYAAANAWDLWLGLKTCKLI